MSLPLVLALALLAADPAPDAGPALPRISPEVSAEKVPLGEPFTYTVTVVHPVAERWELRPPAELGAFGLRSSTRKRRDRGDASTTTFQLELALFDLGEQPVPTLFFDVVGGGAPHTASVTGPVVEGLSSLPADAGQDAKLLDIKPNEDVPVRSWRLVWALLAIAALVAAGLWLRRELAHRRHAAPPPPPRPLPERTRSALEALRAEGLLARGMVREFHFRLSDILRSYLGERFGFEALECTSGELLTEVERRDFPGVDQSALRRFVDQCDVAKFARAEIPPTACEWALGYGFSLVDATTLRPVPVAPDAA